MKEKRPYDGHNRKPINHRKLARHRRRRRGVKANYRQFVEGQHTEGGYYRLN